MYLPEMASCNLTRVDRDAALLDPLLGWTFIVGQLFADAALGVKRGTGF